MDKTYYFPPISLLRKTENKKIDSEKLRNTAIIIQKTLLEFEVKVVVVDISVGTRFTRYEIQPEASVKISEITKRKHEIQMATAAKNIHIEVPIPGKAAIGIDIENQETQIVALRDLIETREFMEFSSNLACAMGRDIVGKPVIIDLSEVPHLLIGGTTGSGKTVFINSLIMSILYKASPDSVKMVMMDTKGTGLKIFNGIPHLLIPVVTNVQKSLLTLKWVVTEIEERYKKFAECGVKDLKGFNSSSFSSYKIPQILVIIDDLSDLMAVHRKESEQIIAQIAQASRGTGIHLIIATQRPSTDVVTGLIKANIPSRIAFSVFSAIDSRVILEEKGAEELLGNGDMFFKPHGYEKPIRIQGTYVSDEEIYGVVDFLELQTAHIEGYQGKKSETLKIENAVKKDNPFGEDRTFVVKKENAPIEKLQKPRKNKKYNFLTMCVGLVILLLIINIYTQTEDNESKQYTNGFEENNSKELDDGNNIYESSDEEKEIKKIEVIKDTKQEADEEDTEAEDNLTHNPFPNTEEYIVNNTLLRYNEIAEFPIDDEFIDDMKEVERPLGKANITISNGVYFIIRYNDYNRTLFIDYQEETTDDSGLYAVMRDMIKAVNPNIKDEDIEIMWRELETGKYSNYYGDKYEIAGFDINFSSNKLNNGQTRYSIKTEYSF